jgi:hypothetical protein
MRTGSTAHSCPPRIAEFLRGRRFLVAGVSRDGNLPSNHILRTLRKLGYEAIAVNPYATEIDGQICYADVSSVPGAVDGVIVATHPGVSAEIVRRAARRGIRQIWFHRSFGEGSVSEEALETCRQCGLDPIVGGCPLMYCEPVDFIHRCFRWWLVRKHRIPE